MTDFSYKAFIVEELKGNQFIGKIGQASTRDLPAGDLLIQVKYSSLNYKDALSASGNRGVTRSYPHTPGIDAAGIVEHSTDTRFKPGQAVIVTSYDLGMNTPGGFGRYIRVPSAWALKLPKGLTLKQSMILGTAGFTAGMSIEKMIQTIGPDKGRILVTGATGGVGSIACGILCHLGYQVIAVSGKTDTRILDRLGVEAVVPREDILKDAEKALPKARWAGTVDTVGGRILAAAIKATGQDGVVTCCGNVASPDLPINVFPFILRGVSLLGIDSQHCPMDFRQRVWTRLASDWKFALPDQMVEQIGLDRLKEKIEVILKGGVTGRILVDLEN